MAGNYPDVPNHRVAYDRDGSVGFAHDGSTVVSLSSATLTAWNNEDTSDGASRSADSSWTYYWGILFAVPTDVDAIFAEAYGLSETLNIGGNFATPVIQTSTDTTNGLDGTWTNAASWPFGLGADKIEMRTLISDLNVTGCKGIRIKMQKTSGATSQTATVRTIHVYGTPSTGEAPHRLRFWHPTLDEEVDGAFFDWGDTPRNAVIEKTFRIKNPSATLTANDVTLTTEALTDTTPANTTQHTFSSDGTTFTSSLNIGNLAPGATSSVLTVKREVPSDAALSLWWARLVASAASYT